MNEIIIIGSLLAVVGFAISQKQISMKDLTGYHYYRKTSNGIKLYVEYKINDMVDVRLATKEDVEILKRFKYIK